MDVSCGEILIYLSLPKKSLEERLSDFAVGLCNDRCLGTFFLKWVL